MTFFTILPNIIIDGLSYSMVLFMISVGLAVSLGLMHFVNMAHGAFAMLGGFGTIWLMRDAGLPFGVAALVAIVLTGLIGYGIERALFRRVYDRSPLDQALVTIGVAFVAMAVINLISGPNLLQLDLPETLARTVDVGFRQVQVHRLVIIVLGFVTMLALWLSLERSRIGISLRATVDNAGTAQTLGINTRRLCAVSFALGAGLAALGGISGAEILPMEPGYALKYIVVLLAVVAVGGHGTIMGSFFAALLLGMIETAMKYLAPDYSYIAFFLTLLGILAIRPHGLFGNAEAAA